MSFSGVDENDSFKISIHIFKAVICSDFTDGLFLGKLPLLRINIEAIDIEAKKTFKFLRNKCNKRRCL